MPQSVFYFLNKIFQIFFRSYGIIQQLEDIWIGVYEMKISVVQELILQYPRKNTNFNFLCKIIKLIKFLVAQLSKDLFWQHQHGQWLKFQPSDRFFYEQKNLHVPQSFLGPKFLFFKNLFFRSYGIIQMGMVGQTFE